MTGREPYRHLYIWPERLLYIGPSQTTRLHRNHAATWLNAAEGKLRVTLADGQVLHDQVIYLPSGTEYAAEELTAPIAALYWEPESASFMRLVERIDNRPRAFPCPAGADSGWELLQHPDTPLAEAERLLAGIYGIDAVDPRALGPMDARIASALLHLRESPQDYDSIEALAARVHLSPSRFAHLFKTELGVPVRRYVLWLKLRRAWELAVTGDSLTSAALSAGFADSAHLSRTVRAMLGIAPEFLFRHRERLIVHR